MANEKIRLLNADEIECRVSTVKENGVSLLLYKDARVDQRVLDETFGPFGWKRSHQSIDGKNMEEIADEIVQRCHRDSIMEKLELPALNEYSGVKSLLHGMLVNTERNRETLGKMPHREFLDLSLVYCVEFPFPDSGGTGSVQVTDGLMELWGKTEPDLYGQAMENMVGSDMADLFSMADIFKGIQGYIPNGILGEAFPMYILTNQRRFHGAAQILNNKAMKQAEKQVGQDFFILPSSIHETILVPAGKTNADAQELAAIVHEVNGTCVPGEEFLSDHVYQHCAADERIKIVA